VNLNLRGPVTVVLQDGTEVRGTITRVRSETGAVGPSGATYPGRTMHTLTIALEPTGQDQR
jgi:hypothetical protein